MKTFLRLCGLKINEIVSFYEIRWVFSQKQQNSQTQEKRGGKIFCIKCSKLAVRDFSNSLITLYCILLEEIHWNDLWQYREYKSFQFQLFNN